MSGAETLARALRNAAGRSRAFCKHRPRKTELDALPGRSEVKRREVPKAFLADPRVSHFSVVQNASATSQGRDFCEAWKHDRSALPCTRAGGWNKAPGYSSQQSSPVLEGVLGIYLVTVVCVCPTSAQPERQAPHVGGILDYRYRRGSCGCY